MGQKNHTKEEIEAIRQAIGYGKRDLSMVLGIPLRTVESYFYGDRAIPQGFVDRLLDLQRKDQEFFAGMPARIDKALEAQFGPGGTFTSDSIPE